MSDVNRKRDVLSRIESLERRLGELERTSRLTSSSIKEGSLVILDDVDQERVILGKIGSEYGLRVSDSGGKVMFEVTDEGLVQPQLQYVTNRWLDPTASQTPDVQGGAYGVFFFTQFRKQTPKFSLQFLWYTSDASTKGQIRIRETISNTVVWESAVLGPDTAGQFVDISQRALIGRAMGDGYGMTIEAKRTAGTGSFRFFVSRPLVSSQ